MSDTPGNNEEEDSLQTAEMMDREERRALKEKKKAEEAAKKTPAGDKVETALARGKIANAEKTKRKKQFRLGLMLVGLALIVWLGNYLFAPFKAGMTYGICKTFLELDVQFPQELRISTVDDLGESVRIWYTQVDAFGQYRLENIHCYFRADDVTGAAIDKISINRRPVDQDRVEKFNVSIPAILQNPPDLTIPRPLPDSLKDLQINTDAFRFQINLRPK